jgi:Family of unknown function (DUF6011)
MSDLKGQLTTIEDVVAFSTAGNATLTLRSVKTGNRFTYRIKKVQEPNSKVAFFVSLMRGPDNCNNYQYLGCVYNDQAGLRYAHGRKSRITEQASSGIVFKWFWQKVINEKKLSPDLEVWHEGKCCRCGRKLTVPESVARGLGPDCATRV